MFTDTCLTNYTELSTVPHLSRGNVMDALFSSRPFAAPLSLLMSTRSQGRSRFLPVSRDAPAVWFHNANCFIYINFNSVCFSRYTLGSSTHLINPREVPAPGDALDERKGSGCVNRIGFCLFVEWFLELLWIFFFLI